MQSFVDLYLKNVITHSQSQLAQIIHWVIQNSKHQGRSVHIRTYARAHSLNLEEKKNISPTIASICQIYHKLGRAWHWLHVFPHLALVTCFSALGIGYMFFRTWHRLHVSPRLALVTCFPALGTGCMFFCAWNRLYFFPRFGLPVFPLFQEKFFWLHYAALNLRSRRCFGFKMYPARPFVLNFPWFKCMGSESVW